MTDEVKGMPTLTALPPDDEEEEAPAPRRRGRPPGSRNKPKNVGVPQYDEGTTLPTRGTRTRRPRVQKLTPKQVADLALMGHQMAAASLGPKAAISEEQAEALGEAIVPVLEDYGVVLASKVVHLVVLITTLVMVEGPVVMGVMNDMQRQAQERKQAAQMGRVLQLHPTEPEREAKVEAPRPWPPEPVITDRRFVDTVARYSGVEVGSPNTEAG